MKYTKAVLLGLLLWVVPFITSFMFFDPKSQQMLIDVHIFKSIMLLESSLLGVALIIFYFKKVNKNYFSEGLVLGLVWFVVNCVMDLYVLLPMSKMTFPVLFGQIGVRYLIAPIMAGAMGYMRDQART